MDYLYLVDLGLFFISIYLLIPKPKKNVCLNDNPYCYCDNCENNYCI